MFIHHNIHSRAVHHILRWHDAESDATATLQLVPNNSEARFRRGLALTELRQWNRARQGEILNT